MGTDTELRVHLTLGFACLYCGVAICSVWIFPGRREPGAGDKVEGDISQPGGAEISDQRANAPRLCASRNFGSGYAGLDCYIAKSIISAKIFKLRVGSVCQYLLLWQRVVR